MEHIKTLLQNIHEEMVESTFNDLQIVCEDGRTTSSRLALAAMSPYFKAMLTADMAERRSGVLNLPFISLSSFKDILSMCFCGLDLVNEENCIRMLDAAEMMQLGHIKELCHNFLKTSLILTCETCLDWWRLMKQYSLLDLSDRALYVLTDNLATFIDTDKVSLLSKEEVLEILSKDDLKCPEKDVMKLVMKWIEKNNHHSDDVVCLFEKLRLDIVDPRFLVNEGFSSDVVDGNGSVNMMIHDVLISPKPQIGLFPINSRFSSKTGVVFVMHHDGKPLLSCFTPDNTWLDAPQEPEELGQWYSASTLGSKIYITGGDNNPRYTLIYNICRNVWQRGPSLNQERTYHCMATVDNRLFVIGGKGTGIIEELDNDAARWQVVGDLAQKREQALAVTVGDNILVMGGTMHLMPTDIIQCYNATTHAACILRSRLFRKSFVFKGAVHLPDVFLFDYYGTVAHIVITEENGKIHIQTKSVAKWLSFHYYYGLVHREGKLLIFNKDRIRTFNLVEGREESNAFTNSPRSGHISNVLSVFR